MHDRSLRSEVKPSIRGVEAAYLIERGGRWGKTTRYLAVVKPMNSLLTNSTNSRSVLGKCRFPLS